MNANQLVQLSTMLADIPNLVKKAGKDGQYIKAFVDDAQAALASATTDEQRAAIMGALALVVLKGLEGAKKVSIFSIFNWDPFKDMRLKCDDVARLLDFKAYRALRNI